MKRIDIMKRAGRNLRQAKGRTLLTSLAIAVGAFTLTLSLAAGEGARQYADKIIKSNIDPQSVYVTKENLRTTTTSGLRKYSSSTASYNGVSIKTLSSDDIKKVTEFNGVERVLPRYLVSVEYMTFQGIDAKYTSDVMTYDSTIVSDVAAGSLPELGVQIGEGDAVVPDSFAETLSVSPQDLVGKKVTLRLSRSRATPTTKELQQAYLTGGADAAQALFKKETRDETLTIRAVTAKSSTSFSTSTALYISDKKAKALSDFLYEGTDQYQQYVAATAIVKQGVDPELVKADVKNIGLHAMTAQDVSGIIFTMVNVLQGIVTGFGVLALIASVFGIINTQYISVLERTSQIGLMKALGMSKRAVGKLFRYEAAWIGFIGGCIGAGLAYGIGTAMNPWITETLTLGSGNYLLIFIWWQIALLLLGLILVAIVAGWFPSRKAAKLDPIEALRTE